MVMPRPTKKRVTKKSRRLVTFAVTSSAYGNVESATPGDEGAHFAREAEERREFGDHETPRDGAHEHELRQARHALEERREHEAAHRERCGDEEYDASAGLEKRDGLEVVQAFLDGEEEDDEEVLQHEQTQRHAAGQGIEFALVVEHLDDDDRTAQGGSDAEVKCVPFSAGDREAQRPEERDTDHAAADDLRDRAHEDRTARADDFLQIDLEADHEKQEEETEFGDGLDRVLVVDEAKPHRADGEAAYEIGEDDGLLEELGDDAQGPCCDDTNRDFLQEMVSHLMKRPF